MHVEFGPFASFCLVFFVFLFSAVAVGAFVALAFAVKKIEQQVEKLTNMAEPVIAKATNTLDTVQRITVNVGEKADAILTKGEALTDTMSEKVEQTTTVVQDAVTTPLINLSSLITGVSTGLSVWSQAVTHGTRSRGSGGRRSPFSTDGATSEAEERVVVTPNGR
jgi:predicted PurR-regulated permease PerM